MKVGYARRSTKNQTLQSALTAVAKRRDDQTEIGELKRLVTVLIQEIDDWPSSGLLLAATNHSELLDPAIWRRFEMVTEFPLPEPAAIEAFTLGLLANTSEDPKKWARVMGVALSCIAQVISRFSRQFLKNIFKSIC